MNTLQKMEQIAKDLEQIARISLYDGGGTEKVEQKILKIVGELEEAHDRLLKAYGLLHDSNTVFRGDWSAGVWKDPPHAEVPHAIQDNKDYSPVSQGWGLCCVCDGKKGADQQHYISQWAPSGANAGQHGGCIYCETCAIHLSAQQKKGE